METLADVVTACGLDAARLAERIATTTVREQLRTITQSAIAAGVFGVPTFRVEQELFWGHDRLSYLAERLAGASPPLDWAEVLSVLDRPRGVDRKPSPTKP